MPNKKLLYSAAVEVSREFLGPAGERFLQRQIATHLHIKPEELSEKNLIELVDWVRLAVSLLTDDKELVDDFSDSLLALTGKSAIKRKAARNGHPG